MNEISSGPHIWHEKYRMSIMGPTGTGGTISSSSLRKGGLSPLTNFIISTVSNLISHRNVIVATPTSTFYPLPVISYVIASETQKSVFVITERGSGKDENPFQLHHQNYYMLMDGDYAFWRVPIAYLKGDFPAVEFYLPYAKRKMLTEYKKRQEVFLNTIYLNPKRPKILLFPEEKNSRITRHFEALLLENQKIEKSYTLDFGVVIFENIDRFIYSEQKLNVFLGWIKEFERDGIRFLLHFSNPNSRFILQIKEATNAILLHFGNSMLRNNQELIHRSLEYFDSSVPKTLASLNLDRRHFYEGERIFEFLPALPQGNVDIHFKEAMQLINSTDISSLNSVVRSYFFILRRLFFDIYNVFVNPGMFKTRVCDPTTDTQYLTLEIGFFIQNARRTFKIVPESPLRENLFSILREFLASFNELCECRRRQKGNSYSRMSKNVALSDFLVAHPGDRFIIAVDSLEKKILEQELNNIATEYTVKTYDQVRKSSWDSSEFILVLPGPVLSKHISILFKKWRKVVYFVYEGLNKEHAERQVELVSTASIKEEEASIKYLEEAKEVLGANAENPFLSDFQKRLAQLPATDEGTPAISPLKMSIVGELASVDYVSVTKLINDLIRSDKRYQLLENHDLVEDQAAKELNQLRDELIEKTFEGKDFYLVELMNEDTKQIEVKRLFLDRSYLCVRDRDSSEVETVFPKHLEVGFYIILIDQDVRKSMVDLVASIADIDDLIDYSLLDTWKSRLANYLENHYTKINDFYQEYCNVATTHKSTPRHQTTFGQWTKGGVNYTLDPLDLKYLGLVMGDPFFLENYEKIHQEGIKIQNSNLRISKKLNQIVRKVFTRTLDAAKLTLEEFELFKKIENNIFLIRSIQKICRHPEEEIKNG